MINITKDQSDAITEMAYNLIAPFMCAINIEVAEQDFIEDLRTPGAPIRNAYYIGYIRQLTELRISLIKSAHNGSNPAITELLKIIQSVQNHLSYE